MYNKFFGFKERPFQLVPNPDYLFLSKSHEEAMAHLKYALSHGEGFVEITGEVGTGKTTLCRAFLEDLIENGAAIAYIFNPRLTAIELLKVINDEFDISSEADNIKDLIDVLNTFLMENKAKNRETIVLIDEAQNLSKEVLEQLRLLSNLETKTSKLLQIILVGQPELRTMLDSYELRQLRQRITLSWYLTPLSRSETREYIRHRVNIASQKTEDKFSETAYNVIYKYSRGIPRLINIASDRSLLTAFGFNSRKVTGSIAKSSIDELKSRGGDTGHKLSKSRILAAAVVLVCIGLLTAYLLMFNRPSIPTPEPVAASEKKISPEKPVPEAEKKVDFQVLLGNLAGRSSRITSLKTTASLWNIDARVSQPVNNMDNNTDFFQLAAAHNGFQVLEVLGDWELMGKLNLPAILEFLPPGASSPRYLTLVNLNEGEIVLNGGKAAEIIRATVEEMNTHWTGKAYILWKDFLNITGEIPGEAPKESVFTLKMLLRDIGYTGLTLDQEYDDAAQEAVKKFQERSGIKVDGIVGARTKIALYNEKTKYEMQGKTIPHLRSTGN